MVHIHTPKNNLGCLGFEIGKFYIDFSMIRVCKHPIKVIFLNLSDRLVWFNVTKHSLSVRIEYRHHVKQYQLGKKYY